MNINLVVENMSVNKIDKLKYFNKIKGTEDFIQSIGSDNVENKSINTVNAIHS